jgi:hypothetical protein
MGKASRKAAKHAAWGKEEVLKALRLRGFA